MDGLILAGGEGARLGEEKAVAVHEGRPLLALVAAAMAAGGVRRLLVSVHDEDQRARTVAAVVGHLPDDLEFEWVLDDSTWAGEAERGRARGTRLGLVSGLAAAAAAGITSLQLAPTDAIGLDPALLPLLRGTLDAATSSATDPAAVIPRSMDVADLPPQRRRGAAGLEPLLSLVRPAALLAAFEAARADGPAADRRLIATFQAAGMIELPPAAWRSVGISAACFRNVNTMTDLEF